MQKFTKYLQKGLILLLILGFAHTVKAQFPGTDTTSSFRMPFGYNQIGDEGYVGLRIQPEFTIGKFGIGVDVPLFFNVKDGSFRDEEYNNGSGFLRLIRYVRYGIKKRDKFYIRLGDISGSYLGYGILMNNYTNSPSFERREVGLTTDIRIKDIFGIEMTLSKFSSQPLFAIRPYVRPLAKTDIPILKTLDIGFSYLGDRADVRYNASGEEVPTQFAEDGTGGIAADMGVTVVNNSNIQIQGYLQYARHFENDSLKRFVDFANANNPEEFAGTAAADGYKAGSGFSIGARARFSLGDNLKLDATLERLWYQEHFLPQFFDAVYEIDKDTKIALLATAEQVSGTYGRVSATILDKITIGGGLQIPDEITEGTPAMVHLNLKANKLIPKVLISGNYYKGNLGNLADAFKFDDRSLAQARVGYRAKSWLVVGVDYRWTFAKVTKEENGIETESFEARSMVMPYFGIDLPLGKNKN